MEFILQLNDKSIVLRIVQVIYFCLFVYYIAIKITNNDKVVSNNNKIISIICIIIIGIIHVIINNLCGVFYSTAFLIVCLAILIKNTICKNIGTSILIIIISLSIGYILFCLSVMLCAIPSVILKITNNIIRLIIILCFYTIFVLKFSKVKKFKNGFAFLQKSVNNEFLDILILNASAIVIFCSLIITNYQVNVSLEFTIGLIIFAIIMFITIQKSLQLYYKQKQLIKTLEETQAELEKYKKDVKDLEEENLNISKKSHSLVHKQKQLEYKLNELLSQTETTITEKEKEELNSRIENISKELYTEKAIIELTKTDIPNIDDMLKYQQSECIKNKIDFDLQISGNIHHMINTLISKEDLEILIADHVKDAIIAINHSNNENRSILVRLGKIDECYGIYIYDTGIEFEKETLENLGKKPSTTHADEGGTGMGFMNTFDTLKKCKASLIIKEIGKPSKDNFTKVIMIKFNNKQEFRVESYRNINIEVKLGQDSNNENNSKSEVTIK